MRKLSEKIYISYGYYTNIEEVTDRINTSFIVFRVDNEITQMPKLRVNKLIRKISIHLFNGTRMIFSSGLRNLLGYNESEDFINVYGIPDTVVTLHDTYNTECQLPVSICVL